ncbi:hypothetical protein HBI32_145430 [Parastagonospora nodorum]|nr:hypothetical protein HBI76_184220 [Parastagonospora nodorum]KAH5408654.1 hypothetical protein HBI32_145430 [Parastagonospora nodorum]
MEPIQAAIEEIESYGPDDHFSYTKVAEKHNVSRHTLARRCKGVQASKDAQRVNAMKLSPQQELELIVYIEKLTERGLPPTRTMIKNFASQIAQKEVGKG